jgi:hypothetical protein
MFKPNAIRAVAIIAIILCGLGLSFSAWLTFKSFAAIFSCVSWAILLWASYLGFRLASYKLQENEFKQVALRIYLIIGAALVSAFTGVLIGIVISVILLATLYSLKSNYDSWVEIPVHKDDSLFSEKRPMR